MGKEKYYPPKHATGQFHCPHCNVYAKQFWAHIRARRIWGGTFMDSYVTDFSEDLDKKWNISKCEHCGDKIIWLDENIIYPKLIIVKNPNEDLDEGIKANYMEAAKIFNDSPRAAAALLRLALQKLCKQLGEKGKDINEDIKNLVKKGLNPQIQKSLDILRINGNNAVHPGEINLEENQEKVLKLFSLLNFIAEKMITELKEIDNFYNDLPKNSRESIDKRDGNTES
ncbi:DUF4145 domain-containing protein [Patescibacteria group bacterium]|nr:DUF4145 domain-containing protein [Candidatus Falkowbacteria bacterium]MBU3906604.1 DUF4145 domain-containing protein [Patescibacteria group bacterium]MCG2698152.1 DUF4145 domain-containing protein [Candidatus Parcubacteria bacterium]MBU4014592.1 DUF4145 domain-containing protein [Patescibacteria group bacterium]MBU4027016.1 DUF4145 domain-containing protein [Patescibacteria group bacterium]